METAVILGILSGILAIGFGVGCFQWGAWETRSYILKLQEIQQRAATDAMAKPLPDDPLTEL